MFVTVKVNNNNRRQRVDSVRFDVPNSGRTTVVKNGYGTSIPQNVRGTPYGGLGAVRHDVAVCRPWKKIPRRTL